MKQREERDDDRGKGGAASTEETEGLVLLSCAVLEI